MYGYVTFPVWNVHTKHYNHCWRQVHNIYLLCVYVCVCKSKLYCLVWYCVHTDVFAQQVIINNPPSFFIDRQRNVDVQCMVTLNTAIGPDYSALDIAWTDNNNQSRSCQEDHELLTGTNAVFICTLRLPVITPASAGSYVCRASIIGSIIQVTNTLDVTVQGKATLIYV